MKIIILTSSRSGTASHHIDYLVNDPRIDIQMVIFNEGRVVNRKKKIFRKIAKIFKIGVLGALNGIRIRKWYGHDLGKYIRIEDIESKCKRLNIPFFVTPSVYSPVTVELFRSSGADLAVSLGNGYIPERVFSIPKYGMINIHHEILPDYQNAQSVLWQLYNGSDETGFTIHRIDRHIDTGEIILQERIPVHFRETLADTVTFTYAELLMASAKGLTKVLGTFDHFLSNVKPQLSGRSYTTPTYIQYLKMLRQFRKIKERQRENFDKRK